MILSALEGMKDYDQNNANKQLLSYHTHAFIHVFIKENNIHIAGIQNVPQLSSHCFIPVHIKPTHKQKKYILQNPYCSNYPS